MSKTISMDPDYFIHDGILIMADEIVPIKLGSSSSPILTSNHKGLNSSLPTFKLQLRAAEAGGPNGSWEHAKLIRRSQLSVFKSLYIFFLLDPIRSLD